MDVSEHKGGGTKTSDSCPKLGIGCYCSPDATESYSNNWNISKDYYTSPATDPRGSGIVECGPRPTISGLIVGCTVSTAASGINGAGAVFGGRLADSGYLACGNGRGMLPFGAILAVDQLASDGTSSGDSPPVRAFCRVPTRVRPRVGPYRHW